MPSSTVIPEGSTVLVTGVTGVVGGAIANEILKAGYKVRGVIRSPAKGQITAEALRKYGENAFQTVVVEDLTVPGALDEAMQGCSGVVHAASDVTFGDDPNIVITSTVKFTEEILKSAAKVPTIKRFVYTSSSNALVLHPQLPGHITSSSWNDEAIKIAFDEGNKGLEKAYHVYSASKVLAERACFKFVEEHKPGFVLNSICPNFNIGPLIHPKQRSSSLSIVPGLLENDPQSVAISRSVFPQYHINSQDNALLHLAGLTLEELQNERLVGMVEPVTYNGLLDLIAKFDPSKKLPEKLPTEATCQSTVDSARALEILKKLGRPGFISLEESVRQNLETIH